MVSVQDLVPRDLIGFPPGAAAPAFRPGAGAWEVASAKAMGGSRACRPMRALLLELDLNDMDDGGMYLWAGILAVVGLAASFGIALAWQRWKGARKQRETRAR